ncbi:MAG: host-nuclease inhibitor Gam family protein [Candidatus Aquicultorales bacterium]
MPEEHEVYESLGAEAEANAENELDLRAIKEALEIPEETPFDPGAFVIDTDDKANWAIKRVAEYETEAKRIEQNYKDQLMLLNDWRERELRRLANPRSFFEGHVFRYIRRLREAAEKAGSFRYALPAGTVRVKDQAPEFKRDEAALVAFFELHNYVNYVKSTVVKKPDWATFKDLLKTGGLKIEGSHLIDTATGQIIEGVEVLERPAKLELDFAPGAVS